MIRLERLLQGTDRSIDSEDLKDIATMRQHIPELDDCSDGIVHMLYSNWSEDFYCAGWLIVDDDTIREFRKYLTEEV